jgi:hypothetical protein
VSKRLIALNGNKRALHKEPFLPTRGVFSGIIYLMVFLAKLQKDHFCRKMRAIEFSVSCTP